VGEVGRTEILDWLASVEQVVPAIKEQMDARLEAERRVEQLEIDLRREKQNAGEADAAHDDAVKERDAVFDAMVEACDTAWRLVGGRRVHGWREQTIEPWRSLEEVVREFERTPREHS
jgi:regulator of protease activity HflC (stomatin/prohibitin superfamily)